MADYERLPGAVPPTAESVEAPASVGLPTVLERVFNPLPSTASSMRGSLSRTSLTPLVCDERAIARLLETLLVRGGLSANEAARRLGVSSNAVRQYLRGRRNKPSLLWFLRLAELCGAKVSIEFPER